MSTGLFLGCNPSSFMVQPCKLSASGLPSRYNMPSKSLFKTVPALQLYPDHPDGHYSYRCFPFLQVPSRYPDNMTP